MRKRAIDKKLILETIKTMRKNVLGLIALFVVAIVAAWNVSLNSQNNQLFGISLANVEALAEGNEEDNTKKCSRIVRSCTCSHPDKGFVGMAILECEEYIWRAPMVQQTCRTSSCPYGANCS
ncbi:MAG: NVEALA domain-containing protein [Prevotellaceae bacterium]|jgi:hypothetical protein|nr:NVEALA domain-containing protein [Prevotellaceae bacterium]